MTDENRLSICRNDGRDARQSQILSLAIRFMLHPEPDKLDKMIELPYEIWLMIVDCLPTHHVRRLYSVNRILFSIALDLRYKHASIGILPDRVVEKMKPPVLRYVIAQLWQILFVNLA